MNENTTPTASDSPQTLQQTESNAKPPRIYGKLFLFAENFLAGQNLNLAYTNAGYSSKLPTHSALRLLKMPTVAAYIEYRRKEMLVKYDGLKERVIDEYSRIAFADPRKFYNADGTPKEIQDLDDDAARALGGVEVDEIFQGTGKNREKIGLTKKYKLWSKTDALNSLSQYLGMFQPNTNIQVAIHVEHLY